MWWETTDDRCTARVLTGGGVDPHGQLLIRAGLEEAFYPLVPANVLALLYLHHPLMDA